MCYISFIILPIHFFVDYSIICALENMIIDRKQMLNFKWDSALLSESFFVNY